MTAGGLKLTSYFGERQRAGGAFAVGTRPRIEAVLARTVQLNRTGLVTLERPGC